MATYTNVPKPTSSIYSNINVVGKQIYDDAGTSYDSSATPYDGVDMAAWHNISKPNSSVYTKISKPT